MWQRQIHFPQRGRLRVVDEDEVVLLLEPVGVEGVVGQVGLLRALGQRVAGALQGVVELLGHLEEALVAGDHLPVGVDPQPAQEGYLRAQELGDPAAVGGRVEVEDAGVTERPRELADLVEERRLDQAPVPGDRELADVDMAEHGASCPIEGAIAVPSVAVVDWGGAHALTGAGQR